MFTLALKWFFLAAAAGLTLSTLLGIYMAFKFNRNRALVWGLLFLGTATPVALIAMMAFGEQLLGHEIWHRLGASLIR